MICKNCGTKFDTNHPDENGIVTCPECGKRYRKRVETVTDSAAKASVAQAQKTEEKAKETQKSGFARFMSYKIGGMLPAWCACLAVLIVAVILIVALPSGGGGDIEGTWILDGVESEGSDSNDMAESMALLKAFGAEISFTFKSGDFTMYMSAMGQVQTQEGTYRVSGDRLYLDVEGEESESVKYSISGDRLTMEEPGNGSKLIFVRK